MQAVLRPLALLACLILHGCMTYSHKTLGPQPPLDAPSPTKPSVVLQYSAQYLYNGKEAPHLAPMVRAKEPMLKALEQSQRFEQVILTPQAADRYMSVTVTHHEQGNQFLAFISGFSLMLIPSKADMTVSMDMVFRDADGEVLGTVRSDEQLSTWFHLVLLPGFLFSASYDDLIIQLTQHNLAKAQRLDLL